jgi:TatA/E family protein of Tat protein translocase
VDILGIGPLELVLILVVALLVFGPDKLPEIGAKLGKGVRELRQLSREISQGVNTIVEPIDELRKPFDDASQVVQQVSATAESLRNPSRALQNALNQQLTTAGASSTEKENTIAPPSLQESAGPIAAPQETSGAVEEAIEPVAALQETSGAVEEAIEPVAALQETSEAAPSVAAADPLRPESPSQASEN